MIVVRVELWSARDGSRTELARMRIANDGTGTQTLRSYDGATFRPQQGHARPRARVAARPPRALPWNLVAEMLAAMGYRR